MLAKIGMDSDMADLYVLCRKSYEVNAYAHGLKARVTQQLPTGDCSTTGNNCIVNAVMFAVSCIQQGVTKGRAVILGDDLLANVAQLISLKEWENTVTRFHMCLKAAAPAFNGKSTFLSRRIFGNTTTPFLVPKPGKFLARYNVRATQNEAVSDALYMYGKACAHAYECRHVPEFAEKFMKSALMWKKLMTEEECSTAREKLEHDVWFLKISGLKGDKEVLAAVLSESVVCTPDELEDWCAITYEEIGWYDISLMMDDVLLQSSPMVINPAGFEYLASIDI
jgi:hypothetical protein